MAARASIGQVIPKQKCRYSASGRFSASQYRLVDWNKTGNKPIHSENCTWCARAVRCIAAMPPWLCGEFCKSLCTGYAMMSGFAPCPLPTRAPWIGSGRNAHKNFKTARWMMQIESAGNRQPVAAQMKAVRNCCPVYMHQAVCLKYTRPLKAIITNTRVLMVLNAIGNRILLPDKFMAASSSLASFISCSATCSVFYNAVAVFYSPLFFCNGIFQRLKTLKNLYVFLILPRSNISHWSFRCLQ